MAKVHTCAYEACGARLLIVARIPPLNYMPDPAGKVAVSIDDPRRGRFLAEGEQPGPLEHAYSVHDCEGTRHKAQRDQVRRAQADVAKAQRNRRGTRPGPQITGIVVQPPQLPGIGEQ